MRISDWSSDVCSSDLVMQQFDVKIEFVEAAAHFQQATACARCLYGFRRLQYRLGGAAYRIAPGGPDAALFVDKLHDLLGMWATGVRVQLKRRAPRGAQPEQKVQGDGGQAGNDNAVLGHEAYRLGRQIGQTG